MEQDAFQGRRPPLPPDVENCHRVIWELFDVLLASRAREERSEAEKSELIRRFFAPRRERFDDPAQGKLFEIDGPAEGEAAETPLAPAAEEEPPAAPRRKRPHGRRRFPAHFPRVRREHKLGEAERLCPCCGKLRKIIGEEISEQLDYVPGHYQVIEHVRFKYACEDCEEHVAIASKPSQPIEKGAAASGLLAHIGTSKFGDHLPTYRQEEISDRHGWLIPRTTQCGWLRQMSGTLALLVALMAARVLRSRKIHTDDTRVPVIVPGEAKTKRGYFWAYCGDDQHRYSVYDFTLSHCRDGPAWWLRGYRGYLQADAYGGYDGIAIQSEGRLILVSCGAHIRRRFFAQRTLAPEVACAALAWFRRLYQWERQWKDRSDEDRYALRQQHAVPLLAEFHEWLAKNRSARAAQVEDRRGRLLRAQPVGIVDPLLRSGLPFHRQQPVRADGQALRDGPQGMAVSGEPGRRRYGSRALLADRQCQTQSGAPVLLSPRRARPAARDRARPAPAAPVEGGL